MLFLKAKISASEKNINTAMTLGLGHKLPSLLDCPLEHVRCEVAEIVGYISLGLQEYCDTLIDIGVHSKLATMLCSPETSTKLREQVLMGLLNIASDSASARDKVLDCEILPQLTVMAQSKCVPTTVKRMCSTLVIALCKGTPSPPVPVVSK